MVLHAASVTPEPKGKFCDKWSAYFINCCWCVKIGNGYFDFGSQTWLQMSAQEALHLCKQNLWSQRIMFQTCTGII